MMDILVIVLQDTQLNVYDPLKSVLCVKKRRGLHYIC